MNTADLERLNRVAAKLDAAIEVFFRSRSLTLPELQARAQLTVLRRQLAQFVADAADSGSPGERGRDVDLR